MAQANTYFKIKTPLGGINLSGFPVLSSKSSYGFTYIELPWNALGLYDSMLKDWVQIEDDEYKACSIISKLAFRNRFTQAEKVAIYTAAKTSVDIQIWIDDLNSAITVDLYDAFTIAGVKALETAGLIAVGRSAIILTP